jgi:hypothetical protein
MGKRAAPSAARRRPSALRFAGCACAKINIYYKNVINDVVEAPHKMFRGR